MMAQHSTETLPSKFKYRTDLRHHVTPRLLRKEPIHNWFVFPHSFSPQLIDEVLKKFPIKEGGTIIDPFVGAGTTILKAKELGYSAIGTDLSPLSIFSSNVKIKNYNLAEIQKILVGLTDGVKANGGKLGKTPERLQRAFTEDELVVIMQIKAYLHNLRNPFRDFFLLALLNTQQKISRAVPDGGWFRWVEKEDQSQTFLKLFINQVEKQINDLNIENSKATSTTRVIKLDARKIHQLSLKFDGLITSPPYPNRHDYSRIFHMELLSLGVTEKEIFKFRYSSLRSHVEAHKPTGIQKIKYVSKKLKKTLISLQGNVEPRIISMLQGYFDDMYLCLKSAYSSLKPNAPAAFVVGNVRHGGVMICVDEILAEIGEQAGFTFRAGWVARLRGNSAQQMANFGREASRETVVIFTK